MTGSVLADTCAWIDFFRGKPTRQAGLLEAAIVRGDVVTCEVVLYELLQGIKNSVEADRVLNALQGIPNLEMSASLWIKAGTAG